MSTENLLAVSDAGITSMAMMQDGSMMDRMIRFAEIMATGKSTIPVELRNVGDCLAITMQAMAWRMMPQAVAQKTFFIGGKIGYEAQLVAAAVTNSGAVTGAFTFEWFGPWERIIGKFEIKRGDKGEYRVPGWKLADEEGIGIRCSATLRGESGPRTLELLLAQARTRNSTLWAEDPKQQLAYLAQKRWARLYAPAVILGVYTPDELDQPEKDMGAAEVVERAPQSLPPYTDEQFSKNLPTWTKSMAEGKVTADQVIARVSSKAALTEDQIKQIRDAAKPAPAEPEVLDAETDDFVTAYEGAQE